MALLQNSLMRGLVAYWPLHEASGDAYDVAGRGLTLTDNNTVTAAEGKVITSRQFTNSASEHLLRATEAAIETGDIDFTLAFWLYLDNKSTAQNFMSRDNASSQREYYTRYNPGTDRIEFAVFRPTDSQQQVQAGTFGSPTVATWHFVTAWHDATNDTANIEINMGGVDSTATGGALQGAQSVSLRLGGAEIASSYLDGRMCEAAFWKRVLTVQERAWLYNRGLGRTWPFDGTFSPALARRDSVLVRAGVREAGVIAS